jgi:ABC-2 type transport system permease protein
LKAFWKLLIADFREFLRDRVALFFAFAFPVIFMVIFGFVFSDTDDVRYSVGLVDEDNSPVSAQIVQSLSAVPPFDTSTGTLADELNALRKGDRRAIIQLPAGLGAALAAGQASDVVAYYDPSQTTSSQIILSILREVINGVNQQISQRPNPLQLREESILSRELGYIDFLVPGVLAMSLMFLGLYSGLTQVDRREKKVLKRFGATPLNKRTVVLSQIIQRLIVALMQAAIIIAVARLMFDVQMVGNWFVLLGVIFLGTLTLISIGYFIVARARTAESAQPIIQLVQFPMMFLSGIFFPIEIMPAFIKPVVMAMPVTYLGDALRQVMVDATPLYPLGIDLAVLSGWLVVCMLLSFWLFKWE